MESGKRATISDVAKAAGVSPTAVSFAFNNPTQVGAGTVERIYATARELGYSPNPIARALLSQRTGVIGVLVPFTISESFANPFISAFMQGVGSVCDEQFLGALIVSPLDGSLEEATKRAPVDGYIVLGLNESREEIEPLRRRRVPLVIVDGDAETVSQVNADDEGGAYRAADHLLAKGHRHILIITFESPVPVPEEDHCYGVGGRRFIGYKRAFTNHNMPMPSEYVIQAKTSIEGGAEAFAAAWEQGLRPTAALAISDAMALGVLSKAAEIGISVPGELEVIGFDDVPIAPLSRPALSTVHQPIIEKGQIAAELLVAALEGNRAREEVLLPTHLVLRGSTR